MEQKNISWVKQTTDSLKTLLFIPEKNWQISECLYDDQQKKNLHGARTDTLWALGARISNRRGVYSRISSKCDVSHSSENQFLKDERRLSLRRMCVWSFITFELCEKVFEATGRLRTLRGWVNVKRLHTHSEILSIFL